MKGGDEDGKGLAQGCMVFAGVLMLLGFALGILFTVLMGLWLD